MLPRLFGTFGAVLLLLLAALPVQALPTSPSEWLCPTNNSAASCEQAKNGLQLVVDETAPGSGQVAFTLINTAADGSGVQWYIQDLLKTLFTGPPVIVDGAGTSTGPGANPPTPPGVNPFTVAYSASSNAGPDGVVNNGLQLGDGPLQFIFTLNTGVTPAMVDEQLESGDLAIAAHVVSLVGGFSEGLKAVFPLRSCPNGGVPPSCTPQTEVPEPASSAIVLALSLLALGSLRQVGSKRT